MNLFYGGNLKNNNNNHVNMQPTDPCHSVNCNKVTFSVANTEAPVGHVAVRMEDDRHDIPRRGELWRGGVTAKYPKEVPLILRYAIVDLDVVVSAAGVVLELKVVKGEEDGGTLCHHN